MDLDILKKLSGLQAEAESVSEGMYDGKSREELLKMKAEAEADIKNMQSSGDGPQQKFYDETQMMMAQQHLDDINNALKKVGEGVNEASGEFAQPFYDLLDDYCGGDCPSQAHQVIIDSLVGYMSGDEVKDFVDTFRREHDMNHPGEDDEYGEDDPNFESIDGAVEESNVNLAQPADPNSMYARLMGDINEIQKGAMEGDDMADFIADELGDYLRNGDAPEGSVYEKAIGIVMDAIHDGPQAQADAAEQAGDFLHSELNKEDESIANEGKYGNPAMEGHTYHCKDCGCEMHNCKPGCDCPHDSHDESGDWWEDENGNGIPDKMEETVEVAVQDLQRLLALAGMAKPQATTEAEVELDEYANDPDEDYFDADTQLNKMSGGLNGPKKQYKKEYPGDNPLAVELAEKLKALLDK